MAAVRSTVPLGEQPVTRIGLGTNRLSNTAESHGFLRAAVDEGVKFIDTAHVYTSGESESAIGAALAPFGEDLVIATKGGYHGGGDERLRSELARSFERLRTETIPLYYLHRIDPEVPIEETMGLLKEYQDTGRVTHVGLSQLTVPEIDRARTVLPIAAVQNEYNLSQRKHDDVVDYCASAGIAFVPFFPLRGGKSRRLREIAERHNATPGQIKLAALLHRSQNVAPIPGTLSIDHLRENLGALEIELSDEELETLGP